MANIRQQKKRIRTAAAERVENLRYRSTIKTLTKRLEAAVSDGDADRIATEHRELVQTIDRAISRGALHRGPGWAERRMTELGVVQRPHRRGRIGEHREQRHAVEGRVDEIGVSEIGADA